MTGEPQPAWVVLNGQPTPMPERGELLKLLARLQITPETPGVAVAVNDRVVPRAQWADWRLSPGDRVEVVRAVQGG